MLEHIKTILKSVFNRFDISLAIEYEIQDNFENIIKDYWKNILFLIQKEIPSSNSWIKDLDYDFKDNTITIYVTNRIINYALENNQIPLKIERKIKDELDLNINVVLDTSKILENGDEVIKQTLEEERKISLKALNVTNNQNNGKKNNKTVAFNPNYIFGKKIDEAPMKIKDITSDTGLAIICGEIFQLETRDIKGNRKLVTFNITDLTDSMSVKVFFNRKTI